MGEPGGGRVRACREPRGLGTGVRLPVAGLRGHGEPRRERPLQRIGARASRGGGRPAGAGPDPEQHGYVRLLRGPLGRGGGALAGEPGASPADGRRRGGRQRHEQRGGGSLGPGASRGGRAAVPRGAAGVEGGGLRPRGGLRAGQSRSRRLPRRAPRGRAAHAPSRAADVLRCRIRGAGLGDRYADRGVSVVRGRVDGCAVGRRQRVGGRIHARGSAATSGPRCFGPERAPWPSSGGSRKLAPRSRRALRRPGNARPITRWRSRCVRWPISRPPKAWHTTKRSSRSVLPCSSASVSSRFRRCRCPPPEPYFRILPPVVGSASFV